MDIFEGYVPHSSYLLCVDSDGCAMDTMDVKHIKCFCPLWIKLFGLEEFEDEATELWLNLNLYSHTRGINRFQGLAAASREMINRGASIEGLEALEKWVSETKQLSAASLKAFGEENPSKCIDLALEWSAEVNKAIAALPDDDKPFPMVKEGLEKIAESADIVGVSSANASAVDAEWERHGLKQYTRLLCCQEQGTKSEIIKRLLTFGYAPEKVLMVGDAAGDRKAAEQNGVHFFPILVGKEGESWERLADTYFPLVTNLSFDEAVQAQLNSEMEKILK